MTTMLNDIELRVLGVLMEKALTTPDAYPLTINSLVAGANQKQNRDPILSLTDGDVSRALQTLSHKGLAHQAPPEPGARANRFRHTVVEAFHWDKRGQAIMTELILRGRQTAGELRSRASRMCSFADLPAVLQTLAELAQADPPFVEELPREPGRSANRWRHLLSEEAERAPSHAAAAPSVSAGVTATPPAASPTPPAASSGTTFNRPMVTPTATAPAPASAGDDVAARLAALERRMSALEARLGDDKNSLGGKENCLGA